MDEQLAPGTRLGPYEIEALIGSGGMGRVYRASDPRLSRRVAVKTLSPSMAADPEVVRRFETEARTVGTLDHPNLLVVFDVGRVDGMHFLVSELLEGETLRERLRRQGACSPTEAVAIAVDIVRGLAAAHARGIVHRDLKPENIFLTRDRRLKILDFGIAKRIAVPGATTPGTALSTLTAVGAIVGTVGYMSPEQVLGEEIDARSDLFAVGVVLHELLTGAGPFQRDSALAALTAIVNDAPPPLPASVPPALSRIVARCLEKDRALRFHSAHDLGIALELVDPSIDATARGVAAPSAIESPPARVSRRQALWYGTGSFAVLAGGIAGGVAFLQSKRPSTVPSFRRLTFRRGLIRAARMAPDGETVLYGALWDGERCRVHTTRIGTPESRALDLPNANLLAVSRSGELALALGTHATGVITYGTLARVPLTGGAPREVLENVKFADWSPDGSELAVIRRVDGADQLEYPIGRVLVRPRAGENSGLGFARVSPDGTHVAYVQYRGAGSLIGAICTVDRAGAISQLTGDYVNVHGLAWRGREVWFTAADDQPLFRAVRAVASGGQPRLVSRMPGNATLWDSLPDGRLLLAQTDDRAVLVTRVPGSDTDRDLSWLDASWVADVSRDGRSLLFSEFGQGGGHVGSAYLRGTDGAPAVRLGEGQAYALSPDARWALCAGSPSAAGAPAPELALVPTGAGEARRISGGGLLFTGARWLPDGARAIVSALEAERNARLYRLDIASGRTDPITPAGVSLWAVSPDGAEVAVAGPQPHLAIHPTDGGPSRAVPGTTAADRPLGWVERGLLVSREDDSSASPGAIQLLDARSGDRRPWDDIMPQDPAGIMVLVTFAITPNERTRAYTWHRALSNLYVAEGLA